MNKNHAFKTLFSNCKKIVKKIKKSDKQQLMQPSLKPYIKIRWTSVVDLFGSVYKNYDTLNNLLAEMQQARLIRFIKDDLGDVLQFFQNVTDLLSYLQGDKIPTIHNVNRVIEMLTQSICKVDVDDILMVRDLKTEMDKLVKSKMVSALTDIHHVSSLLNPSTRKKIFSFDTNGDNRKNALEIVKDSIKAYKTKMQCFNNDSDPNVVRIVNELPNHRKKKIDISQLDFGDEVEEQERVIENEDLNTELNIYLNLNISQEKAIEFAKNPLTFWKDQTSTMPMLSSISRAVFIVQASSAPSERLFSLSGQVLTNRRIQLNPETASSIIFLNSFHKLKETNMDK